MTWTYIGDLSTPLDQVRFAIGDTDIAAQLLSNEEINAVLLAVDDSVPNASMVAVKAILAKLARSGVDRQVGDLRISNSQLIKHYRDLLGDLTSDAAPSYIPVPFAGGISIAGKATSRADTDRVRPAFTRDDYQGPVRDERYGY